VTLAFASHADQIAAVIVEPVLANVGVLAPAPGYLAHLREVTQAAGALLIFDEVITGFRLGPGGAQALYGIRPDLTTLGKIIGGGMPIGAYGGRADLMALVAPEGPVYQAGTLSGHPLSMAAGIATLAALQPERYVQLDEAAARLERGLREAAGDRAVSIARVGSLLSVFFLPVAPSDADEAMRSDRTAYARFFAAMLDAGILLPPSPFETWFVSLAHGEPQLELTVRAAEEAFAT
jgi:glutamate-1-semialdehyde 2,1-aminomutase